MWQAQISDEKSLNQSDRTLSLSGPTFALQTFLSERINAHISQLTTAFVLLRPSLETTELIQLTDRLKAAVFGENTQVQLSPEFPLLLGKMQLVSEQYRKKHANSFEVAVPIKSIQSSVHAIIQILAADALSKMSTQQSEPIHCGEGEFNWVLTNGEHVVYIPKKATFDSLLGYKQRKICCEQLSSVVPTHPRILEVHGEPFSYAVGELMQSPTISQIFLSPNHSEAEKRLAAQAVGAYLRAAINLPVNGYGRIQAQSGQELTLFGKYATWSDYAESVFHPCRVSGEKSAVIEETLNRLTEQRSLKHALQEAASVMISSAPKSGLVLPDPGLSNFSYDASRLQVYSTDWDCALISTPGELAGRLFYCWVFSREWQQPRYHTFPESFRFELVKEALRVIVPDTAERVQVKKEAHAWLVLSCYSRAAAALARNCPTAEGVIERSAQRFVNELKAILQLKVL